MTQTQNYKIIKYETAIFFILPEMYNLQNFKICKLGVKYFLLSEETYLVGIFLPIINTKQVSFTVYLK